MQLLLGVGAGFELVPVLFGLILDAALSRWPLANERLLEHG